MYPRTRPNSRHLLFPWLVTPGTFVPSRGRSAGSVPLIIPSSPLHIACIHPSQANICRVLLRAARRLFSISPAPGFWRPPCSSLLSALHPAIASASPAPTSVLLAPPPAAASMPSSGGPGGQWNVAALLARRPAAPPKNKRARDSRFASRFEYLVQWEDHDPTTGEPYEPTWEPTTYITPAAIESYYIDKYEAAGTQQPDQNAADAASPAPAPNPAPKEKVVKTAAAPPAKADNEAAAKRPKNPRAEDTTPKRQRNTRTATPGTKETGKETQGADGTLASAPPPRKRGTSPTPDKENTKRIRVADMLLK